MIHPKQIPDKVVEAALPFTALCASYCKPSANDCQCRQNTYRALAAALNAWPGAKESGMTYGKIKSHLYILPLPEAPQERGVSTENSDE